MRKKRIFTEKPKIGSVEWQRMVIKMEVRESLKEGDGNSKKENN